MHPTIRSVTALAKNPQAPRHRYRVTYWSPAVAQTAAPRLSAFGHRRCSCPAAAAPLRRPATNPARQLAACRRLPRHILHRARGFATGFVSPAVAVQLAPAFALGWLGHVRPAACAISFAHGFVGCAGRCPVSAAHRFRACPAGPAGRDRPPATALPLAPRQGGSGPLPRRWRARWPAAPVVSGWQHRCSTSCTSWPAAAYLR